MPEAAELNIWVMVAGLLGALVLFGAVAGALRQLGILPSRQPAIHPVVEERLKRLEGQVGRIEPVSREVTDLRVHVAEQCLHREDWTTAMSRVTGMLERQSIAIARLETALHGFGPLPGLMATRREGDS